MFAGKNIDRHKQDIEKRIQDLSSKLKQSRNFKQSFTSNYQPLHHHHQHDAHLKNQQRYRNNYCQEYIEPREVTRIRNALKERQSIQNIEGRIIKKNDARIVQQKELKQNSDGIRKDDNMMYDMMSQILKNQKNLQNQIHLLRQQWYQDQNKRQSILPTSQIQNNKNIKLKMGHSNRKQANSFIQNKNDIQQNSFRLSRGENVKKSSQNQSKLNRQQVKPKSRTKKTAIHNNPNIQDIAKIVKNQKSKSQRFCVEGQLQIQLWKAVEQRIKQSEKQYKDSNHRNNRFQHEHLINTVQLQKKLKDDLMAKVYSQCNSCIYK